jgi:hypothetical protein
MRLIVLTVMGLMAGLGLAAAIVSVPVMANKGPQRATLVAPLGGAQEQKVQAGGNPDGRGRAVVKVFEEQLCARIETTAIESSSSKATIHLGMSGEKGPTVANLQEQASTTSLPESTTPTTGTTATTEPTATTGTTTGTTGTTSTTTGTTSTTTGTTTPTSGTTTATTGATGAQAGTTTTGDSTSSPQATTTEQSTTVEQTSLSQSTASPTASASASASASVSAPSALAASTSTATNLEHTGGCVAVPRALSLELLEHPARFYVKVANGQSPEGAIRGQLQRSGNNDHRSRHADHRSRHADDD